MGTVRVSSMLTVSSVVPLNSQDVRKREDGSRFQTRFSRSFGPLKLSAYYSLSLLPLSVCRRYVDTEGHKYCL